MSVYWVFLSLFLFSSKHSLKCTFWPSLVSSSCPSLCHRFFHSFICFILHIFSFTGRSSINYFLPSFFLESLFLPSCPPFLPFPLCLSIFFLCVCPSASLLFLFFHSFPLFPFLFPSFFNSSPPFLGDNSFLAFSFLPSILLSFFPSFLIFRDPCSLHLFFSSFHLYFPLFSLLSYLSLSPHFFFFLISHFLISFIFPSVHPFVLSVCLSLHVVVAMPTARCRNNHLSIYVCPSCMRLPTISSSVIDPLQF